MVTQNISPTGTPSLKDSSQFPSLAQSQQTTAPSKRTTSHATISATKGVLSDSLPVVATRNMSATVARPLKSSLIPFFLTSETDGSHVPVDPLTEEQKVFMDLVESRIREKFGTVGDAKSAATSLSTAGKTVFKHHEKTLNTIFLRWNSELRTRIEGCSTDNKALLEDAVLCQVLLRHAYKQIARGIKEYGILLKKQNHPNADALLPGFSDTSKASMQLKDISRVLNYAEIERLQDRFVDALRCIPDSKCEEPINAKWMEEFKAKLAVAEAEIEKDDQAIQSLLNKLEFAIEAVKRANQALEAAKKANASEQATERSESLKKVEENEKALAVAEKEVVELIKLLEAKKLEVNQRINDKFIERKYSKDDKKLEKKKEDGKVINRREMVEIAKKVHNADKVNKPMHPLTADDAEFLDQLFDEMTRLFETISRLKSQAVSISKSKTYLTVPELDPARCSREYTSIFDFAKNDYLKTQRNSELLAQKLVKALEILDEKDRKSIREFEAYKRKNKDQSHLITDYEDIYLSYRQALEVDRAMLLHSLDRLVNRCDDLNRQLGVLKDAPSFLSSVFSIITEGDNRPRLDINWEGIKVVEIDHLWLNSIKMKVAKTKAECMADDEFIQTRLVKMEEAEAVKNEATKQSKQAQSDMSTAKALIEAAEAEQSDVSAASKTKAEQALRDATERHEKCQKAAQEAQASADQQGKEIHARKLEIRQRHEIKEKENMAKEKAINEKIALSLALAAKPLEVLKA